MHGLDQSQALTRAAQKLSAARERYYAKARLSEESRLRDSLEGAELAYKAAYKAYTNPFGVKKTTS